MSYHEVRDRPLFAMYFANRDRVVRLADAPAELLVNFAHSNRLKIDEVFPPIALRRLSETEESTEVVSLFLDKTEGITPQHLAVHFGYFSKVQAWALVLIPAMIFALGQAVGPMLGRTAIRLVNAGRVRFVSAGGTTSLAPRQTGVVLPREVLQNIVPGQTTRDDVIRLCGADVEQLEAFPSPTDGRSSTAAPGRSEDAARVRVGLHGRALGRGGPRGEDRARAGRRARRGGADPIPPAHGEELA